MIGAFNVVQKILLIDVEKLKELMNRRSLSEFNMDEFNDEREKEGNRKEKICNEYLMMNLLVKVFNIRTQNIILFNDVFRRTA
jgi:hypothetical protein